MKTIGGRLWTCPRCGHRFVTKNLWHSWLDIGVWLTRRVEHPTLRRVEELAPRSYVHSFRLHQQSDIDAGLAEILAAAAAVGRQEHLSARAQRPR